MEEGAVIFAQSSFSRLCWMTYKIRIKHKKKTNSNLDVNLSCTKYRRKKIENYRGYQAKTENLSRRSTVWKKMRKTIDFNIYIRYKKTVNLLELIKYCNVIRMGIMVRINWVNLWHVS